MDAPSIAAQGSGLYSGISSRRSHRSSPVCRSCRQRLLMHLRGPAASTRATGMNSVSGARKMADGPLSSRSGGEICCTGGSRRSLKQSVKKETCQRLMAGTVVSGLGRAFEASTSSSSPQTSGRGRWDEGTRFAKRSTAERRLFGEVDHLRGESIGGGLRSGRRAGDAYSSLFRPDGGNGAVASSSKDDLLWGSSSQSGEVGGFHSIGEGRSSSAAIATGAPDFTTGRGSRGNAHDKAFTGTARQRESPEPWGGHGVGRGRTNQSRHAASAIPSSEILKIEELRFSGDIQEGDAGPQVLNLQRALFWTGHLRGLSLTGYFGPETARALREFQFAQGLPTSGVWGFASREKLWKHLHPEEASSESAEHGKAVVSGVSQLEPSSSHFVPADAWHFLKALTGKARRGTERVSDSVKALQSHARTDFLASVSAGTHPTLGSGTLFLAVVIVSSIVILMRTWTRRPQGQPVKRRIMSLRNDVDSTRGLRHSSVRAYRGSRIPSSVEANAKYLTRQGDRASGRNAVSSGNVVDRLVFYDGQVVRGDQYFGNGKSSPRAVANSNFLDDSLPKWDVDQFRRNEPSADIQKSYGVSFRKPEMDPPRTRLVHNQSQTYVGNARGGDAPDMWSSPSQETETSPASPVWSGWVSFLFPATFAKERYQASRKGHSRRIVPGVATTKRSRYPDNGRKDVRPPSRFEIERQKKLEQNELELKLKMEDLHRTVQTVEQTRVAAVQALKEEKMQNLALEEKMRNQKKASAALEEELRVLKDSHEVLLTTLRKKYSSSAAARAAAALLYQNWDPSGSGARV